jgi:hypothetical protein
MPCFGRLPCSEDGALGRCRQILGVVGPLLLLLILLGSELSGRRSGAIFFNKLVAAGLCRLLGSQDVEVLLAGRGGEGENGDVMARYAVVILPAGLGGEGESGCSLSLCAPGTRSRFVGWCCREWWGSRSFSSPACRGGEEGGGDGAAAFSCRCWPLPKRCYIGELNHAVGILATAIFCRHGGKSSTSDAEALHRIRRRSSVPLRHQVVRPRWLGGDRRLWFFVGRGCSSSLPLILGGDAFRTPAICGGGTQGLDRFSYLCPRVFFTIWKALSSICWFFRASFVWAFLQNVPATC